MGGDAVVGDGKVADNANLAVAKHDQVELVVPAAHVTAAVGTAVQQAARLLDQLSRRISHIVLLQRQQRRRRRRRRRKSRKKKEERKKERRTRTRREKQKGGGTG